MFIYIFIATMAESVLRERYQETLCRSRQLHRNRLRDTLRSGLAVVEEECVVEVSWVIIELYMTMFMILYCRSTKSRS